MSATSGKPDGFQVFPLEPRVQGRFARIAMAEDPFFTKPASCDAGFFVSAPCIGRRVGTIRR